ncbi:MAG: cytochrome c [Flavobacteriales bacterium]|nr:cytochrome c [Flavobacteriales bacterium]
MKLNFKNISLFAGASILMMSCSRNPDSPGYEYMPDMYRSQAVEAYVDYGLIKDVEHEDLKNTMSARKPAMGSIPFNADPEMAEVMMPYSFTNTEDGYNASKGNAIPMKYVSNEETAIAYAEEGKVLFGYFCSHCHGKTGKGDGAVITYGEYNAPMPYDGGYKDRTLGQIFHVITYGKGAMGPHGSQLNKDERWKVALHVRTLQYGNLMYSELMTEVDSLNAMKDSLKVMSPLMIDTNVIELPLDGSLNHESTEEAHH